MVYFASAVSVSSAAYTKSISSSPYCKVCHDAGCSETEYTSHFVKSRGQVVCPTLLNQACRICKVTGHTSSYCPNRNRNPRQDQREEPRYLREEPRYLREEPRRYLREEPRRYLREEPRYLREEPRRERDYRIRLNLEAPALCASKHAVVDNVAVDVRAVDLHHAKLWSDEDSEKPFICDPHEMCSEFIKTFAQQDGE